MGARGVLVVAGLGFGELGAPSGKTKSTGSRGKEGRRTSRAGRGGKHASNRLHHMGL